MIPEITLREVDVGPLHVHVFGTLLVLGLVAFHVSFVRSAKLPGRSGDLVAIATVAAALGGMLGLGPLLHGAMPSVDAPLSTLVAVALAVPALVLGIRLVRAPFGATVDHAARSFVLGLLVARLGCALVHDHLGRASESALAVAFASGRRFDLAVLEVLFLGPLVVFAYARRAPTPGALSVELAILYVSFRWVSSAACAPPTPDWTTLWAVSFLVLALASRVALFLRSRADESREQEVTENPS